MAGCVAMDEVMQRNLHLCPGETYSFRWVFTATCLWTCLCCHRIAATLVEGIGRRSVLSIHIRSHCNLQFLGGLASIAQRFRSGRMLLCGAPCLSRRRLQMVLAWMGRSNASTPLYAEAPRFARGQGRARGAVEPPPERSACDGPSRVISRGVADISGRRHACACAIAPLKQFITRQGLDISCLFLQGTRGRRQEPALRQPVKHGPVPCKTSDTASH